MPDVKEIRFSLVKVRKYDLNYMDHVSAFPPQKYMMKFDGSYRGTHGLHLHIA